jgi:2,4-dienoyl-CoA reductase-like NADH-dependent reductase (Old Yellow Enzyme family)/thioredoxin reductase
VNGYVTQQFIDYHVARAKGGCALNILEACSVHPGSAPKRFLSIADDSYIAGLRRFNDAMHEAGGKTAVQLWQGGLAVSSDPTAQIVLPNDMVLPGGYTIPGANEETIQSVFVAFGEAARRAVEAGFDTMEFHAAHNYSPHSFLSAAFNHRTDRWGGSLEARAQYALECIKAIRRNIPADMPLLMRVDAQDDYVEHGLTGDDIIQFCKWAGEAGVDVLDVSRGNIMSAAIKFEVPPIDLPLGFNVDNAARIREATGMITVAVGRINDPAQAEEILATGKADMVVIGRGQIADADFCIKAMQGRADEIVKCIGCNQGCFDSFVSPTAPHITCTRNPAVGREVEYALRPTEQPKRVLIAGGGVAGLEAASVLKERGHEVVLYEASNTLGGQFLLAGMAPRKQEMGDAARWMGERVLREGVEVHINQPLTPDLMRSEEADALVIAIGAHPLLPPIEGSNQPHVFVSHDVLAGRVRPTGHVVVIGGGLVGLEVAETVAGYASAVTVVEMLDDVAGNLGQLRKITVLEELFKAQVRMLTKTTCKKITPASVIVEKEGVEEEIACNAVILAVGAKSNDSTALQEHAREMGIPYFVIGDASTARRALEAIAEGASVGRAI